MIILHLYMRISYIQYTTCNKIMEEEKKGLSHSDKPFFLVGAPTWGARSRKICFTSILHIPVGSPRASPYR